jgi:hypothetical protein
VPSLDDLLGRPAWDVSPDLARAVRHDAEVRDLLAMRLWGREPLRFVALRELLPGLEQAGDPGPMEPELSVRTHNVMGRSGRMSTWPDLASHQIHEIALLPNCGVKTVAEIIAIALRGWSQGTEPPDGEQAPTKAEGPGDSRLVSLSLSAKQLLAELWAEEGYETIDEIIRDLEKSRTPAALRRFADEHGSIPLSDLTRVPDLTQSTWTSLFAFDDPRELAILERRVYASDGARATLEQLSAESGVTRERIRQIEMKLRDTLQTRLAEPEAGGVRHMAARAAAEIGDVCTPEAYHRAISEVVGPEPADAAYSPVIARGVIRDLIGPHSLVAGLQWTKSGLARLHALQKTVRDQSALAPLTRAEFDSLLAGHRINCAFAEPVMTHLRLRDLDGTIVDWGMTLGDHTVAVLQAAGSPMSMDALHQLVDPDRNPQSFAEAVRRDDRLIRTSLDSYGLVAWGGSEYRGIAEAIEEEITDHGGEVPLATLVSVLTARFGVAESSVRQYAHGRRFIIRDGSRVAMRGTDDPEPVMRIARIEDTRGTFRLSGSWHLRTEVDTAALRGSGRLISRAVADVAGLEPDLSFGVDFDGDEVMFYWTGQQPALGSIRSVLTRHACVEGDVVLFPLSGSEPRGVRVVRGASLGNSEGIRRLSLEAGLPADGDQGELRGRLGDALVMAAGADWIDIRDRLESRGETVLASLIPKDLM